MKRIIRHVCLMTLAILSLGSIKTFAVERFEWRIVTDAAELQDGDEIVIANLRANDYGGTGHHVSFMTTSVQSTYGFNSNENGTTGDNKIFLSAGQNSVSSLPDNTMIITLKAADSSDLTKGYFFTFVNSSNKTTYLYVSSSSTSTQKIATTTTAPTGTSAIAKAFTFINPDESNGNPLGVMAKGRTSATATTYYKIGEYRSVNSSGKITSYFRPYGLTTSYTSYTSVIFKKITLPPLAPEVSVHDACRVLENTIVKVSAEAADSYNITSYKIDGTVEYVQTGLAEEEAYFTVDEKHRRFKISAVNETGESPTTELFYDLYREETGKEAKDLYEVVTDPAQISDGDKIMIASVNHYEYVKENYYTREDGTYIALITTDMNSNTTGSTTGFRSQEYSNYPKYISFPDGSTSVTWASLPEPYSGKYMEITVEAVDDSDVTKGYYLKYTDKNYNTYYLSARNSSVDELRPHTETFTEKTIFKFDYRNGQVNALTMTGRYIGYTNATGSKVFRTYSVNNGTSPCIVLKKINKVPTDIVAYDPEYGISLTYVPYSPKNATSNIGTLAQAVATTSNLDLAETSVDGKKTNMLYTTSNVPNLQGDFSMNLKGENIEMELQGDKDAEENQPYIVTAFHDTLPPKENENNCTELHNPYLFVGDMSQGSEGMAVHNIKLIDASSEKGLSLSTDPNKYHGRLINHPNPTVQVEFSPFYGVSMNLISTKDNLPTSVGNIALDNENASIEYYTLQGVRVAEPLIPGNIYIERRGSATSKIVVK